MSAVVEQGATPVLVAAWRPVFDPAPYVALQWAWVHWMEGLMGNNHLPLSGNVEQWIRTWGEAVSQIGLVNVNVAGSGNPQLEKRIGSQFSYGRQLGRMLDVLVPLVKKNEATLRSDAGDKPVQEFLDMAKAIAAMKRRGVADIVDEVSGWRRSADFDTKLAELLPRPAALERAK